MKIGLLGLTLAAFAMTTASGDDTKAEIAAKLDEIKAMVEALELATPEPKSVPAPKSDRAPEPDRAPDPEPTPAPTGDRLPVLMHGIPDFGVVADRVVGVGETKTLTGDIGIVSVEGQLTLSGRVSASVILVKPTGRLAIEDGTIITFTDSPIDTAQDPETWGLGLLCLGDFQAIGRTVTPFSRATSALKAGDKSVTLSVPVNWEIGDRIVVPDTLQKVIEGPAHEAESEVVRVTSVVGNVVTFTPSLKFDHLGTPKNPWGIERFPHLANLTRSIELRSENPSGNRAHIVFAGGRGKSSVMRYCRIAGMGRTEARAVDNTKFDGDGNVTHRGTNQIARYPYHTHHWKGDYELTGCAIEDGKKWSVTIHATDGGLCQDNVVYLADGAGIATEDASETGNRILRNFVCDVRGGIGEGHGGAIEADPGGVAGDGYWFRGPSNTVEDNVCYDCQGNGYNYNGYYRPSSSDGVGYKRMESCRRNEAVSCLESAIWFTWSQGCCGANSFGPTQAEDFLAWNCTNGYVSYHDANITIRDMAFIADPARSAMNKGSHSRAVSRRGIGINYHTTTYENWNMAAESCKAAGFNIGLVLPFHAGDGGRFEVELKNHVNILAYESKMSLSDISAVSHLGHSSGPGRENVRTPIPDEPTEFHVVTTR